MADPLWQTRPITLDVTDLDIMEYTAAMREKSWSAVKDNPLSLNREEDFDNAETYLDIESNTWVTGVMEKNLAFEKSMQLSYDRGIWSRNVANDVEVSRHIMGGRDLRKYDEDSVLGISESNEQKLRDWGKLSKWNLVSGLTSWRAAPGVEYAYDTPEEMFSLKQDNWNTEEALEVLAMDQVLYGKYISALGGAKYIEEAVEGSRNSIEFWYKLNLAVTNRAIAHSVEMHNRYDSGLDQIWTKSKNFVVSGILNDPDMVASLGLSAALAALGAGALGGAIFIGKTAKKATDKVQALKRLSTIGHLAKWQQGAKSLIYYLPENIGPTILNKTIFKKVAAQKGITLGKVGTYTTGNVVEGFISGGLAEIMNQYHRTSTGVQEEVSWDHILTEAKWEAAFSPFINPVMAGIMMIPHTVGSQALYGSLGGVGQKMAGKELYNMIQGAFSGRYDIDATMESLTATVNLRGLVTEKTGLAFQNDNIFGDESVGILLNTVLTNTNLSEHELILELTKAVENIDPTVYIKGGSGEKTISLPALYTKLFENLAQKFGLVEKAEESFSDTTAYLAIQARIAERASELGLSIQEYQDKVLLEDNNFFDLVDPQLKKRLEAEWDARTEEGGTSWEEASNEEKLDAAIKVQDEIIKKAQEARGKLAHKLRTSGSNLKEATNKAKEHLGVEAEVKTDLYKEQLKLKNRVEDPKNASPVVLLKNIDNALKQGLITDLQAQMLRTQAESVSQGNMSLSDFNNYIQQNINPKAVITEVPILTWLQSAHDLSVSGVEFNNRLTGEKAKVETEADVIKKEDTLIPKEFTAEATPGSVKNVLGNEVQLDENNNLITDEEGNTKILYTSQVRERDLDTWDPETDEGYQKANKDHEDARELADIAKEEQEKYYNEQLKKGRSQHDLGKDKKNSELFKAREKATHAEAEALFNLREYVSEHDVRKPVDWADSDRTMGQRSGVFLTPTEAHARSYQGQKGVPLKYDPEQVTAIAQGNPIIIDVKGASFEARISTPTLLNVLPKAFIDWMLKSGAGRGGDSKHPLTRQNSGMTLDILTSALSSWHTEAKRNGEDTSKFENVIIFENIEDVGSTQEITHVDEALGETVYVVSPEQLVAKSEVDKPRKTAAPETTTTPLFKDDKGQPKVFYRGGKTVVAAEAKGQKYIWLTDSEEHARTFKVEDKPLEVIETHLIMNNPLDLTDLSTWNIILKKRTEFDEEYTAEDLLAALPEGLRADLRPYLEGVEGQERSYVWINALLGQNDVLTKELGVDEFVKILKKHGYDSVVHKEGDAITYAVLSSEQMVSLEDATAEVPKVVEAGLKEETKKPNDLIDTVDNVKEAEETITKLEDRKNNLLKSKPTDMTSEEYDKEIDILNDMILDLNNDIDISNDILAEWAEDSGVDISKIVILNSEIRELKKKEIELARALDEEFKKDFRIVNSDMAGIYGILAVAALASKSDERKHFDNTDIDEDGAEHLNAIIEVIPNTKRGKTWRTKLKGLLDGSDSGWNTKRINHLYRYLQEIHNDSIVNVKESDSYKVYQEAKSERLDKVGEALTENNKQLVKEYKEGKGVYVTLSAWREVSKMKSELREKLRQDRQSFEELMTGTIDEDTGEVLVEGFVKEGQEEADVNIVYGDFFGYLSSNTSVEQNLIQQMNDESIDISYGSEITVPQARALFESSQEEARASLKTLEPGSFRYMPKLPRNLNNLKGTSLINTDHTEYMFTDLNEEELLTLPIDSIKELGREITEEAIAYVELLSQLEQIQSIEKAYGPNGGIYNAAIYGIMPKYMKDRLFTPWDIFKEAIIDNGIVNKDSDAVTLQRHAGSIEYRMKGEYGALAIMRRWAVRISSRNDSWSSAMLRTGLEARLNSLLETDKPDSVIHLIHAEKLLEQLEIADALVAREAFLDKNDGGYILDVVTETGRVGEKTTSLATFETSVALAINGQVEVVLSNEIEARVFIKGLEKHYPDIFDKDFKNMLDEDKAAYLKENLSKIIIERTRELYDTGNLVDTTIERLGNGEITRQPASSLGKALVDALDVTKHMPMRNHLGLHPDKGFYTGDIVEKVSGESLIQLAPGINQINEVAPLSPVVMARLLSHYKTQKRVDAILAKKKFTKAEKKAIEKWREEILHDPNVDRTGIDYPVTLMPKVVGSSVNDRVIKRSELKDFLAEMFLGLPHIGTSAIHDAIIYKNNTIINFADGTSMGQATWLSQLTAGSKMIVPFNQIGMILAIEATAPVNFSGLTRSLVKQSHRVIKSWEEEYGKDAVDVMFSKSSRDDRNFNALVGLKLLSLARDTRVPKLIDQIENGFIDEDGNAVEGIIEAHFKNNKEDFYIAGGIGSKNHLFDENVAGVNTFLHVFEGIKHIKSISEWNAEVEAAETSGDSKRVKQLKALRELFKIPTMRKVYQGGFGAFQQDFNTKILAQARTGVTANMPDGIIAIIGIERAFKDEGVKFTEDEINNYGRAIVKKSHGQVSSVIEVALGLSPALYGKVLELLEMNSNDMTTQQWKDTLEMVYDNPTIGDDNPLYRLESLEKQMEGIIQRLAQKDYGIDPNTKQPTPDSIKRTKKKYQPRIDRATKFINDTLEAKGWDRIIPNTPEWETLKMIMMGVDIDTKEGREKGRQLYRSMGYFRALNIHNASAKKFNVKRMGDLMTLLGLEEMWDEGDWAGIKDYLIYTTALPSSGSTRSFRDTAGRGMNEQGMWLERVAVEPDKWVNKLEEDMQTIADNKYGGDVSKVTLEERQEIFLQYTEDKDNRDSFGMLDLENNPYDSVTNFDEHLEQVLTQHELMQYAEFAPPPFADYRAEDNDIDLIQSFYKDWDTDSRTRPEIVESQIALEEKFFANNNLVGLLNLRQAVLGGVFSKEVASKTMSPLLQYSPSEIDYHRVAKDGHILTANEHPRGPLALQAPYKQHSYYRKGVIRLQRLSIKKEIKDAIGEYQDLMAIEPATDAEAMMPDSFLGWPIPWKVDNLPNPLPFSIEENRLLADTGEVGRRAVSIRREMLAWAEPIGLVDAINKRPEALPYFYHLMMADKLRQAIVTREKKSFDKELSPQELEIYRMRWIDGYHKISDLSRTITETEVDPLKLESEGFPMAIVDPDFADKKMSEILTSVPGLYNNKPHLFSRTNLHDQLVVGPLAAENIILSVDGKEVPKDSILYKDLHYISSVIQGHDFNQLLMSILFQSYIGEILRDGTWIEHAPKDQRDKLAKKAEMYKDKKYWKDPESWRLFTEDEQLYLVDAALYKAEEEGGTNLEFDLIPHLMDLTTKPKNIRDKAAMSMQNKIKAVRQVHGRTTATEFNLRNTMFGMLTVAGRKIKGKQVKLALSIDSALMLFVLNSNNPALQRVNLAYHLKKSLGVTFDEDNNMVLDRAPQEVLDSALGFSMHRETRDQVITSDALEAIMRENAVKKYNKSADIYGSIDGAPIDVLNLQQYRLGAEGFTYSGIEVHLLPVLRMLERINVEGLAAFDTDVSKELRETVEEIRKDIEAVKENPVDNSRTIARLLLLANRIDAEGDPQVAHNLDKIMIEPFHETFVTKERDIAEGRYRRLSILFDAKGDWQLNPWYAHAREFLWQQPGTKNPVPDFLASIEKKHTLDDKQRMLAEIGLALAVGTDINEHSEDTMAWFDDSTILGPDGNKIDAGEYSKTSNKFKEFIAMTKGNPHLVRLNDQINKLTDPEGAEGILNEGAGKVIRAIIIRMYTYNQLSIEDIQLEYDNKKPKFMTARKEGDSYILAIGNKIKDTEASSDVIIATLAHEFAHIATMKFLRDGQMTTDWQTLMASKDGKSYLKKMVTAWFGGRETVASREYLNHLNSEPMEFIAGMVQFHLLNEISPYLDLTEGETNVSLRAQTLMQKVMSYVRNTFVRLHSVFTQFEESNPKLYKKVTEMNERILGHDNRYKDSRAPIVNRGDISEMSMELISPVREMKIDDVELRDDAVYMEKINELIKLKQQRERFFVLEDSSIMKDAELADHTKRVKDFFGTNSKKEIDQRIMDLDNRLRIAGNHAEDHVMTSGITRYDFHKGKNTLTEYGFYTNDQLDIHGLVQSEYQDRTLVAAAVEIMLGKLLTRYGQPVTGGVGLGARKFLEKISSMVKKEGGGNRLGQGLVSSTIGATGANYTYNSHVLLIMMASALLDNRVVHTTGDFNNLEGAPSVTAALEKINLQSDTLMVHSANIKNLVASLDNLPRKQRKEAEKAIHVQVFKLADMGGDFDVNDISLMDPMLKTKEIHAEIIQYAKSFRKSLDYFIHLGVEMGQYKEGFKAAVPYMLNENVTTDSIESFSENMKNVISHRLMSEQEKIDPITLYFIGKIPNLSDTLKRITEFLALESSDPKIYQKLIDTVLSLESSSYDKESETTKQEKRNIFKDTLNSTDTRSDGITEFYTKEAKLAHTSLRKGILAMMREMALGKLTWDELGITEKDSTRSEYFDAIKNGTKNSARIRSLNALGFDVPYHIFYNPKKGSRIEFNREGSNNLETAMDLHYFNFLHKASQGLYHPNESWAVPKISDLVHNDEVMKHIVTDPVTIVETHKKSTGDIILEQELMLNEFGVIGTYNDLLNLIERAFDAIGGGYRHADGSRMSEKERQSIVKSTEHLRAKHDVVRGIVRRSQATSIIGDWAVQVSPHLAKIAFGANLAFASMLVEGMMSSFSEGIGRRNLRGAINSILMPISGNLIRGTEERRVLARDLAHTIKDITHGRYTDYEQPAVAAQELFMAGALKQWGDKMLIPAKQVMSGIAGSRAISFRFFLSDHLNNLVSLQEEMKDAELDPEDHNYDRILLGHMRKAKIPKFNLNLVKYVLNSGLLSKKTNLLGMKSPSVEMFLDISNKEGRDYYSTTKLMEYVNRQDDWTADSSAYKQGLDIITSMRQAEKMFIEEVLVSPNAFDITTGHRNEDGSTSQGPFEAIWEVFRRYPMLFVSQHVVRKSTGFHPMKYAFNLFGLLLLDTLYMMLLRISAGQKYDDLIDEWEERPMNTLINYGVRLPVLGRTIALASQGILRAAEGFKGNSQNMFIAASAAEVIAKDIYKGIGALGGLAFGGNNTIYGQDLLALAKHVPILGETWGRGLAYLMMDHVEAPDIAQPVANWFSSRMDLRRPSMSSNKGFHQGIPTATSGYFWETMIHQGGKELFPSIQHVSEFSRDLGAPVRREQPEQQPIEAPESAPETLVRTKDPIAKLKDQAPYSKIPEALEDIID